MIDTVEDKQILLSVICPIRDMAGKLDFITEWIFECKKNKQIQVIMIVDESKDSTKIDIQRLCGNEQNCHVLEGRFNNPGGARNLGLRFAKGEWVCFWDSDDIPNVKEFLRMCEFASKNNADICFGHYEKYNELTFKREKSEVWTMEVNSNLKIVARNPGIWRIVFSKDLIKNNRFELIRMAEDQIFIMQTVLKCKRPTFYNGFVYTYAFGSNYHATKNKTALKDLKTANSKSRQILSEALKSPYYKFAEMITLKINISYIKYGSFSEKIDGSLKFGKLIYLKLAKVLIDKMKLDRF